MPMLESKHRRCDIILAWKKIDMSLRTELGLTGVSTTKMPHLRCSPESGNAPAAGLDVEEEAGVAEDLKLLADFVADVPIAGMQFLKSRGQRVRILVGEFGFARLPKAVNHLRATTQIGTFIIP